jgi:hypothetical protein
MVRRPQKVFQIFFANEAAAVGGKPRIFNSLASAPIKAYASL